jgi:hypothetical protein
VGLAGEIKIGGDTRAPCPPGLEERLLRLAPATPSVRQQRDQRLKLGQHVRVGAGYTWQHVKELWGQSLGGPVLSKDDIKTQDTYDGCREGSYQHLRALMESRWACP